jgi:hypothetical protein
LSNEALCVIRGIIPINIKITESKYYEITKTKGLQCNREMDVKN